MTDSLRNMPRYIRNTDAFGWQGADHANGPWRSITPPQSGSPFMTTPMNDYRQASAEVSGIEMLSPAAQAVLDAYANTSDGEYVEGVWVVNERTMLAAALRAAADQVAPSDLQEPRNYLPMAIECQRIRTELLAIAAEMESANG